MSHPAREIEHEIGKTYKGEITMAAGNTITLVGNVTREPELRFTPTGQANASFGLAVNKKWQNRQTNEWEESTSFFDIVCWREMAENVSDSLPKGTRVIVMGALQQRSWKNDAGENRSKIEVVADEVGPSLRWATAEIRKNDRQKPGEGSNEQIAAGGYSQGSAAQAYDPNEEPF